jgi:hypothetical protein
LLLEQESNVVWDGIHGVNYHWVETTLNSKYTQYQYGQGFNLIGYFGHLISATSYEIKVNGWNISTLWALWKWVFSCETIKNFKL